MLMSVPESDEGMDGRAVLLEDWQCYWVPDERRQRTAKGSPVGHEGVQHDPQKGLHTGVDDPTIQSMCVV
jgi:hypothetical protein